VVSAGAADNAAVEAGKEQPAWGMQKSHPRVGKKWFPGVRWASPDVKV
jgi:hypothetical protein